MHTRTNAGSEKPRLSSPSTHLKIDVPQSPLEDADPLRTASPTFRDLARHPSSTLQPREDRAQRREQRERALQHVQGARLSGRAGHFPFSSHTIHDAL